VAYCEVEIGESMDNFTRAIFFLYALMLAAHVVASMGGGV
jgi:hypothetical protein